MGLKEEISAGIITSLKAGEKLKLECLRFMLSAIKYKEKEKREDLTDEEVQSVITTLAKQRRDSIEQFRNGGRDDLADKEEKELEILKTFLPTQLSTDEIETIVREVAAELGAESMKDMGSLMKGSMAKLKGKADGRAVQECVKKVLSA